MYLGEPYDDDADIDENVDGIQISDNETITRDIWGVDKNGGIWYKSDNKKWEEVKMGENKSGQEITVGKVGVFVLTTAGEVYYRRGTMDNPYAYGLFEGICGDAGQRCINIT